MEVITYSRIGREDIRFGKGMFEVVLADGRKVLLHEVDVAAGEYDISAYDDTAHLGTHDTAGAYNAALAAVSGAGGGTIVFRTPGTYRFDTAVSAAVNDLHLKMYPGATLLKAFNGNLFSTGNARGTKWENMLINAQGGTYTGAVVLFESGSTMQEWTGGRIEDGADSIFLFESTGGALGHYHDFVCNTHSSLIATGAMVKRTDALVEAAGSPRHFHHITCHTQTWAYRGAGFHGAYWDHVYCNGMDITADTELGGTMINCRWALYPQPTQTMNLNGTAMIITNNQIAGNVVIAAGFLYSHFRNNVTPQGLGTFTDNSIKTAIASQSYVESPLYNGGINTLVCNTVDIPLPSAQMDGRLIIEDAGAGQRNLIMYGGGERFRIDGGVAI